MSIEQDEPDSNSRARAVSQTSVQSAESERYIKTLEDRISQLENALQSRIENSRSRSIEAGFSASSNDSWTSKRLGDNDIVVLVHGIRDFALWQSEIRASLRQAGLKVVLTSYGRLDLISFLLPIPLFRNLVVEKIRTQVRTIRLQNPDARISIIAHSFGTYIMSRIMAEDFDISFFRVVFCGGVFSQRISFEQFSNRFQPPILNEVGSQDFWPAIADSITWGFGSSGTFGDRLPLFEDRLHNEAGHSYFLRRDFCDEFWVPFLQEGRIVSGEDSPTEPHSLVTFFSVFKIKYGLMVLLIVVLLFLYLFLKH